MIDDKRIAELLFSIKNNLLSDYKAQAIIHPLFPKIKLIVFGGNNTLFYFSLEHIRHKQR